MSRYLAMFAIFLGGIIAKAGDIVYAILFSASS